VIDWRKILVAYIDHVGEAEGVDYLPGVSCLSDIENAELARAASEGNCSPEHKAALLCYAKRRLGGSLNEES
jgi:hypothetical protein